MTADTSGQKNVYDHDTDEHAEAVALYALVATEAQTTRTNVTAAALFASIWTIESAAPREEISDLSSTHRSKALFDATLT